MAKVEQTKNSIISTYIVGNKKIKRTLKKSEDNKIHYIIENEDKDKGMIEKREIIIMWYKKRRGLRIKNKPI